MSNHRVVAAIDFGTHGSGFAWAVVNPINRDMTQREIFYFDDWGSEHLVYPKNLSALLLDRAGSLLEWGYAAEKLMYVEGWPDGRKYEKNYKMSLQPNRGSAGTLASSDSNPSADEISRLITLCIRKVYEKALEHIMSSGLYTADDIAWCLTVPAIWDDYAKDLMLKAARRAGMPNDDDRLRLALEPEAAALYCIVKGDQALLKPGCRFMVIDAGGGTIDITSYEVESGPRLSQLATASGDKAGSEYLDMFFVDDVLCDRFGVGFMSDIKAKYPREFYDLIGAWAREKRGVSLTDKRPVTIRLPAQVYRHAMDDGAALTRIQQRQGGVDTAIVIPADELHTIFEKVVSAVISSVAEQLNKMRTVAGTSGGEIAILVGGFAESPYLQSRLREFLNGDGVQMHTPFRPAVAVMTGATHFAYDPSVIRARRSPLTYGKGVLRPFRKWTDPAAKLELDDSGDEWCKDRFDVFVENNEAIETDECRRSTTIPLRAEYRDLWIEIFATRDTDPVYTTDSGVASLADLTVSLAGSMHLARENRKVEVRMYFGDTRIRVEAENLHTGKTEKAEIKWRPTW
jgi:hypothetical protein